MKLVFVNYSTETFSPLVGGSLSTYVWELCQVGRSQGIEATVITQSHPHPTYDWPLTIFVEPPTLPMRAPAIWFERLRRKLSRWPHLREWVYARRMIAAIALHDLADATFLFLNDVELAEACRAAYPAARIVILFQNYHRAKRLPPGHLRKIADRVAAVSGDAARWVEATYGLRPNSVATIYNGVDPGRFSPASTISGSPLVNFTGRICREKGVDTLLAASLKLASQGLRFRLQFLGWDASAVGVGSYGKQIDAMAELAAAAGVDLIRPGWISRDDLPLHLQRASIHVTPSRWREAFGMTTLEAMACGMATIASRTGGTPEVVGEAGLLFDAGDADDLAEQMAKLIVGVDLRTTLGCLARERSNQFTWRHTWDSLIAVLANDEASL